MYVYCCNKFYSLLFSNNLYKHTHSHSHIVQKTRIHKHIYKLIYTHSYNLLYISSTLHYFTLHTFITTYNTFISSYLYTFMHLYIHTYNEKHIYSNVCVCRDVYILGWPLFWTFRCPLGLKNVLCHCKNHVLKDWAKLGNVHRLHILFEVFSLNGSSTI